MIAGLEPWAADAVRAGSGLAIGVLVGLERGFKLRDQKAGTRVAGVRTFSLLGLCGGIAGLIAEAQPAAAAVLLLAALLFLMGAMDVDAAIVTAGGLPPQSIGSELAAIAVGATIVANMTVKIGITVSYARSKSAVPVLALGASTLVLAVTLVVAWMRLP